MDIKCLHTPVKLAGFSKIKKNETNINHVKTFPTLKWKRLLETFFGKENNLTMS